MSSTANARPTIQYLFIGGLTAAAAASAALILAPAAHASPLEPGEVVEDFDTTLADRPDLKGTVVASDHFSQDGDSFNIGMYSQVVRDRQAGTLTFYYRLENLSQSPTAIGVDDVTIHGFEHFSTDVANLLDTAGETAAPVALRGFDGDDVIFDFDALASRIAPGGESFTFAIKTDAHDFNVNSAVAVRAFPTLTDQGPPDAPLETLSLPLFGPSSGVVAVPLPGAALAAAPLAATFGLYSLVKNRRNRRAAQP